MPAGGTVVSVPEPSPECVLVDEVCERLRAVDLDNGETLAVPRFELGFPTDVDELELEAELRLHALHDLERPRAQIAIQGVVNGDARYG